MTGIALLGAIAAFTLLYSGWKGYDPRSLVTSIFTGKEPTMLGGSSMSGVAQGTGQAFGNALNSVAGNCVGASDLTTYANGSPGGVRLVPAAMDAFKAAEIQAHQKILLTGSWRSCATQARLYAQDPNRFAQASYHTAGQAIDVNMGNINAHVTDALHANGWCSPRSDEPWHFSFGGCG